MNFSKIWKNEDDDIHTDSSQQNSHNNLQCEELLWINEVTRVAYLKPCLVMQWMSLKGRQAWNRLVIYYLNTVEKTYKQRWEILLQFQTPVIRPIPWNKQQDTWKISLQQTITFTCCHYLNGKGQWEESHSQKWGIITDRRRKLVDTEDFCLLLESK